MTLQDFLEHLTVLTLESGIEISVDCHTVKLLADKMTAGGEWVNFSWDEEARRYVDETEDQTPYHLRGEA